MNRIRTALVLICLVSAGTVFGGECSPVVASLVSAQGSVQWRDQQSDWQEVKREATFCAGMLVRTLANSRAKLRLSNHTLISMKAGSTLTLTEIKPKQSSFIDLLQGVIHIFSRTPAQFKVNTPYVNASIEGTEFVVDVRPQQTQTIVLVYEGRVKAHNDLGQLSLNPGESAIAREGEAPRPYIVVKPRDGVVWALYFPPVIHHGVADLGDEGWQGALKNAIGAYQKGDISGAFTALQAVNEDKAVDYLLFRASLHLTIGELATARRDLKSVLSQGARHSGALALQAVIDVVMGQKDRALAAANKAVALNEKDAAGWIALSYAHQSRFDLDQALVVMRQAVKMDRENPLAWARLAELWLSHGELGRAVKAARKAGELNPRLARIQTILGFAHLKRFKAKKAKTAFNRAIDLDQAAPLPRLGLGLAKIKNGDLKAGRQDIELASTMDPAHSLIRSYLGKAYSAEGRTREALSQLRMAKERDPKDPTPWLYQAINHDTNHEAVAALENLTRSIELNDNRAVYRSRLLLDQDLGVRTLNLARIYNTLGFEQRALVEGVNSLLADPLNASAHAFLADAYAGLSRYDVARSSELLQAQMLQPLSSRPIRTNYASNHFRNLGKGGSELAVEPGGSLFENRIMFLELGMAGGSDNTLSDDLSLSGRINRVAYRFGRFHFNTDGFRENSDLDQLVSYGFVQTQIGDRLMLQGEVDEQEVDNGFIKSEFDNRIRPFFRQSRLEKKYRIGVGYRFSRSSRLQYSYMEKDLLVHDFDFVFGAPQDPVFSTIAGDVEQDGRLHELSYIWHGRKYGFRVGYRKIVSKDDTRVVLDQVVGGVSTPMPLADLKQLIKNSASYIYAPVRFSRKLSLLVGMEKSVYEEEKTSKDEDLFSHKFGLMWRLSDRSSLRLAAFRAFRGAAVFNQGLEPGNIVGFNQLFEDNIASKTDRVGLGYDYRLGNRSFAGFEWLEGDIDQYLQNNAVLFKVKTKESLFRSYFYSYLNNGITISAEAFYEDFDKKKATDASNFNSPIALKHLEAPIGIRYGFGKFSLNMVARYFIQKIEFNEQPAPSVRKESANFWVGDLYAAFKYKKWVSISVGIHNVADVDFRYQAGLTSGFRDTQLSQLVSNRRVFASLQFWF